MAIFELGRWLQREPNIYSTRLRMLLLPLSYGPRTSPTVLVSHLAAVVAQCDRPILVATYGLVIAPCAASDRLLMKWDVLHEHIALD